MAGKRWIEVTSSQFPHEQAGLEYLRERVPDHSPYRVWTNFEFRDGQGRWHEVDALLLGRGALYLIELKHYAGTISGNDLRWNRSHGRVEDSPLLLARKKAQYLSSKLKDAFRDWALESNVNPDPRKVVPWVQEAVFLHHPQTRVLLPAESRTNLYGPDELASTDEGLPGISELIHQPPHRDPIGPNQELILCALLERIGLVERREREAGSWVIQEGGAVAEGEGWQEWAASHAVSGEAARIRFHSGADESERRNARLIADHEYRVMSQLHHDGLLRPRDIVSEDTLGRGLVYPWDEDLERLDLWLAGHDEQVDLAQRLDVISQVGEVLAYAHGHGAVHRGLAPDQVWVKPTASGEGVDQVKVSGWQTVGAALRTEGATGMTQLGSKLDDGGPASVFEAPEGRWVTTSREPLDQFSLGALAFFVLSGRPPAATRSDMTQRLREQDGLDLAVEVPGMGEAVREAVRRATHPAPGRRHETIADFLQQLHQVDQPVEDEVLDPRHADRDDVLGEGRFRVLKRLGKGSTAVGLLVEDTTLTTKNRERVLKVALDEKASGRLVEEAEVLRRVKSPRVAALVEGPLELGEGVNALLLENAGETTLQDRLRQRGTRLTVDLLERFGDELLAALVDLEKVGIDHRDIKPANLGIGADSRKVQRLKLFDFSLSRAPATALEAGTPPYLDPFLGGDRTLYDSAAERYSAAVVLFEMAAGRLPRYGDDPRAHPASVPDEVTIEPEDFDPALAEGLAGFFRSALARDARQRFGTAADMRREWNRIVGGVSGEVTDLADDVAAAVTLDTPLAETGLTARALSGLEVYRLTTVRDFLSLDPVLLNRMSGTTAATREEIKRRRREWHGRLVTDQAGTLAPSGALSLEAARDVLLEAVTDPARGSRRELAGLILGLAADDGKGKAAAFSSQAALGSTLAKIMSTAAVNQLLQTFHEQWVADDAARGVLQALDRVVDEAMGDLGGVATPEELAGRIAEAFTADARPSGFRERQARERLALGLLRVVTDRRRYLLRAESADPPLEIRRHDERVVAVGRTGGLLDAADALARAAEQAVRDLRATVLSPQRSRQVVEPVLQRFAGQLDPVDRDGQRMDEGLRPVRLAAAVSASAEATSAGELYRRDLAVEEMVRLAVGAVGVTERMSPAALHDRVRSRFPAAPPLPPRPQLDRLVGEAGLELQFDDAAGQYVHPTLHSSSTAVTTRRGTQLAQDMDLVEDSAITRRLAESVRQRSYLVLGTEPSRLSRLAGALEKRFGATVLDVTGVLLEELRSLSEQDARVPAWDQLMAADAQAEGSRARQGLAVVVGMVLPAVEEQLLSVLNTADGSPGGRSPLVLRDVSPLVRYGHVSVLRRLSDLTVARGRAVWVLAPQFGIFRGAAVDGVSLTTSPNQFLDIDYAWTDAQATAGVTDETEMKDHA